MLRSYLGILQALVQTWICLSGGEYIDAFDLCLFRETWALSAPHTVGFATFSNSASQGARGRPYGGLCIWVGAHLGCTANLVDTQTPDILCILLSFVDGSKVAVINVYSRPMPISQTSPTLNWLDSLLSSFPDTIHKIIGGDFNCHYEPLDGINSITQDEDQVWSIPECNIYSIQGWSPLALQLYKLTVSYSLRACNGRFPLDNLATLPIKGWEEVPS